MYTLPANAVASSIFFTQYLDTTKDIVVSFDYACYGTLPTGAEGFCVYFSNTASGCYSGILGGRCNTVTHNNSFAIGSNLTSTADNTTFVNAININGGTLTSDGTNFCWNGVQIN